MSKVKVIISAIFFSVLGVVLFYLLMMCCTLIGSLLLYILSIIPIVNTLLDWLFSLRGDSPNIFLVSCSLTIACWILTLLSKTLIKNVDTRKLTLILIGLVLIVLNVLFLIINVIFEDSIFSNILTVIVGFVIFFKGRNLTLE